MTKKLENVIRTLERGNFYRADNLTAGEMDFLRNKYGDDLHTTTRRTTGRPATMLYIVDNTIC